MSLIAFIAVAAFELPPARPAETGIFFTILISIPEVIP